jgi:hypothetical protein
MSFLPLLYFSTLSILSGEIILIPNPVYPDLYELYPSLIPRLRLLRLLALPTGLNDSICRMHWSGIRALKYYCLKSNVLVTTVLRLKGGRSKDFLFGGGD